MKIKKKKYIMYTISWIVKHTLSILVTLISYIIKKLLIPQQKHFVVILNEKRPYFII